jgi:hypothetical protein
MTPAVFAAAIPAARQSTFHKPYGSNMLRGLLPT